VDKKNNNSRSLMLNKIRSTKKDQGLMDDADSGKVKMTIKKDEIKYSSTPDKFISKLEKVGATVSVIDNKNELIKELNRYVAKNQIQSEITISKDTQFDDYDWQDVDVTTEYEARSISVSVTYAHLGIEETGTLVMLSSPSSPTGMNFLADHHLVVLSCADIVKTMEDVWTILRDEDGELPRTVNLITGPSRTADIEQEIQIGAHGPKNLHVVLIKK
jgi:L-lactate utilization protein LutC